MQIGGFIQALTQGREAWNRHGATLRAVSAFAHWLIRVALGPICLLALAGCGSAGSEVSCEDDSRCLRYAFSADIPVLDPHVSELPEAGMVFRQIYDTLIYRDTDSRAFLPGLATDWEISPDGLDYSFSLRPDVTFHDGSEFTAESVAFNIERIFRPDSERSLARELLGPLHQVDVLDKYKIRLRLFEPHAALLDSLAQPFLGIASPEALKSHDGLRYQYHQSGTGPFALVDYLPGERIKLRRFDGYAVDPAIYAPLSGDEIEAVEFSVMRDGEADLLSMLGSTQDVVDDVSPVAAHNLAGNSRVRLLPTAIPGLAAQWLFNTKRAPLNRRDVRLALLLASNRIAISDQVYLNAAPVAWSPLSESTGYAHTGFRNSFEFDLAEAQALLSAAGYADSDEDGILDLAGDRLELTMLAPPWGRLAEVGAFLREQWRRLGIELVVEPVPGRMQLNSQIRAGEYDLLPVSIHGIDPGMLSRVFLDNSLYAASRSPHPALNDLLIQAGQEIDPARRRAQYYDIQTLLMNAALILPISETVRLRAASANIVDLRYDAFGFYPLLVNVKILAN
ncbi:MAG: ABC transporter substrate-binding protein [Chloroflexota bacterium]|nr:ABC transporter substrate-binding protein [Chloroflexota bacterium]MDE2946278.1 ABC transporter substrate-binding protein [Chloroflexota bacterium]